jgi:hypothetical protein
MKKEKTIHELVKEFPDKSYRELEIYREKDRQQEAGACIMGEMKKDREKLSWQEKYNKEHKLRQEAEGELTILKGIETNRVKEAQDALANALEVNESHQKLNGKLQERLTELEEENKKMHDTQEKRMDSMRKSGM